MRILLANDLYGRSSAAGVAVRMAEGLVERGHAVAFLATTQRPDEVRRGEENGVDVHVVHSPPYNLRWRSRRSLANPAGVAAMERVVAEFRPDVVHVHNLHIHLSYAALAAAKRGGARVVLHVHDIMPVCHQKMFCHLDERLVPGDDVVYEAGPTKCALCVKARWNPRRNATIRRVLLRDVDALVAVSDQMGRVLTHNGLRGADGQQSLTIPNGLHEVSHPSQDDVAAWRREHGLTGRPVVFYGGRLDRLKGGLELVAAMEVVRRNQPRAVLVTVGEALPGFREEMGSLSRRLGMPDLLVHAGWLSGSALAAAYRAADVVVTPSLCFESFGLVNLEAMAAGRPVVASMWGGPADVVLDGQTGYLVNPLRIGMLADRIGRLLADPVLAAQMGAAGRQRATTVFAQARQLDLCEALYDRLVSGVAREAGSHPASASA